MGGGAQAPTPYQPPNQAQAASGYLSTLNNLTATDTANQAAVSSGYTGANNLVTNNPFDSSMVQGTVAAANTANQVGQRDITQGGLITSAGDQGFADANTVRGYAPGLQALAGKAASYADPLAADAKTLRSYAPWLAEMGLDPNFSEFNYGMQQAKDSANVGNAESGLSGSPFAAGVTGDAMASYKRNYDASRLQKGMQALAAMGGLYDSAGNLNMQALQALTASGALTGQAADMFKTAGGIDTNASNIVMAGQGLQGQGADTMATAAMMPYEAENTIAQDQLSGLDQQATGEATMSGAVSNDVAGYGNYLNIGQNATAGAQRAAQINYQDSFMGGLGQLLGTAIGVGAHFIPGYG